MQYKIICSKNLPTSEGLINEISKVTYDELTLSARSAEEVRFSYEKGWHYLCFDSKNGELIGWIEIFQLSKDWWGLFSLYVYPKYRNQKLGLELLGKALEATKNFKVYGATSNSSLKELLIKYGCSKVKFVGLPINLIWGLITKRYGGINRFIAARSLTNTDFEFFIRD
jgi:GNAT superfamily N-acetyltransferase